MDTEERDNDSQPLKLAQVKRLMITETYRTDPEYRREINREYAKACRRAEARNLRSLDLAAFYGRNV
jgi:hypothetical protein